MAGISQGRTVFIIAHRLTAVRHCDRILVMDKARLIEEGSHNELIKRGGQYAQLHGLQLGRNPAPNTSAPEGGISVTWRQGQRES